MNNKKKIIICGGHPAPAFAVIDDLLRTEEFDIIMVGRKYATATDKNISWEYQEARKRNLTFYNINAGKLQRSISRATIVPILNIPRGFLDSVYIVNKEKPNAIVSFGGFVALPLVLVGRLFGIPSLTHEQTFVFGLTNKLICNFVKTVCISWKNTKDMPKNRKVVLTGNPIRNEIVNNNKNTGRLKINVKKPILYIAGGSTGSHSLNMLIEPILEKLSKNFAVVMQTGNSTEFNDYERLQFKRSAMHTKSAENLHIYPFLAADEVSFCLRKATLMVSRAGANTVSEVLISQIPSILIPLPWAGSSEQLQNAMFLSKLGVAKVLDQRTLTGHVLYSEIMDLSNKTEKIRDNFAKINTEIFVPNGTSNVISEIKKLM